MSDQSKFVPSVRGDPLPAEYADILASHSTPNPKQERWNQDRIAENMAERGFVRLELHLKIACPPHMYKGLTPGAWPYRPLHGEEIRIRCRTPEAVEHLRATVLGLVKELDGVVVVTAAEPDP